MAGIFDILGNLNPEQSNALLTFGSGLLQAGGPSLRPIGFGQAFGGALQQAQAAMAEQEQRRLQREAAKQQAQLMGLKIRDAESETANQERQRAEAAQVQKVLSGLYQPAPGSMAPTVANAQAMTQRQQDISDEYTRLMSEAQALRAAGLHGAASQKALEALKFQPEYSTTPQTGKRPTGETFQYVLDKLGRQKVIADTLPRDKMETLNLGGLERVVNPFELTPGQTFQRTQTPDSIASNAVAIRGQNMADSRAREGQSMGRIPPGYRVTADGNLVAIPGGPADPATSKEGVQRVQDARDVIAILDQAEPLIRKSTGSYAGAGIDQAARAFGFSTPGAAAGSELQVLQGALISKMPKMSGPQSDKDVQLYREMAGRIGDTTLPADQRIAAARQVRALNEKYAGGQSQSSAKPRTKIVQLDGGGSASATLGADGNYYVERGGKRYRVEE